MTGVRWRFEERGCPVCGRAASEAILLGRRGGSAHRAGLGVETGVVRCRGCCAVFQRPTALPDGNPYSDHSPEAYFAAHDSSLKAKGGCQLARTASALLGGPGAMLELGCGRGELLRSAAQEGWRAAGVEMTPAFAEIAASAEGVEVELATVETASSLDRRWDAIILAAILEHVYDPLSLLRRVHGGLRPGGVAFIDVPNECSLFTKIGNLYGRLRGTDWAVNLSPTFPPFHVVGFCPTSLRRLLGIAGFEVIDMKLYPWMSCARDRQRTLRDRVEGFGMRATLRAGQRLGMGAGITCWARKS